MSSDNEGSATPDEGEGPASDTEAEGGSFDVFQESVLKEHNRLRAFHGAPPLVLDAKWSQDCQDYAEEIRDSGEPGEHSKPAQTGVYGECLHGAYNEDWANSVKDFGAWVTQQMYSEIQYYDWNAPNFETGDGGEAVGHFTTIVWKSTKKLGVGNAKPTSEGKDNGWVVYRYTPTGYFDDAVPKNVLPLLPGNTKESYLNGIYTPGT